VAKESDLSIFIDFEGNKDQFPILLGVLINQLSVHTFQQYILDKTFYSLAPSTKHPQLVNSTLDAVLHQISNDFSKSVPIYSWSTHEQQVINKYLDGNHHSAAWVNRVTDAKISAKKWARVIHPDHSFIKKEWRGKHTLDQYLNLIDYKVPTIHGPGLTGPRISKIRKVLDSGRLPEDFPRSIKTYWTNLLAHNKHDCYGLMALMAHVNSENPEMS
jgi:hypothetical protein